MFLNPLGCMCEFTVNVFCQSLKFIFSLIGNVFMYFVFNIDVFIFFLFKGKLPMTGMTITKLEDSENHKNAFEISGIAH